MVFNCDSHQSLSENRGSQSESNEDPIRAYQKREDLSKTLQKPWVRVDIFDLLLQSRPPLKKNGGAFTIVDVTFDDI